MKADAAEEARRWEEEQEAELRRKEAMKLSQEERDNILQVSDTMGELTFLRGLWGKNPHTTQVKIEIQYLRGFTC